MRVEIDERAVGQVHCASVLLKEIAAQAAVGVQFHTGHNPLVGELLAHGGNGGFEFRRRVGEIGERQALFVAVNQLQTLVGAFERGHCVVEIGFCDAQLQADLHCACNVLQVVLAKHRQSVTVSTVGQVGDAVGNGVGVGVVGQQANVGADLGGNGAQVLIAFEIDE